MMMTHPGLPSAWGFVIGIAMLLISLWALWAPFSEAMLKRHYNLAQCFGGLMRWAHLKPGFLFSLKLIVVALFLWVIAAGLFGTPIAERNLATVLTWNLWWSGLIIAIFWVGSAWCAVCPWDTLANWLVHRRLWQRAAPHTSLGLQVPKQFRNVLPALGLFIILTWLELGVGVTINPYATALLSLLMIILATFSLAVFERKAFCRYFCPVGRTIGFYAQLAPVELRPINSDICARCTTLECYHGNDAVDGCPTHLVMGRLTQNTYCTSCGHCVRACPHQNITWRLRPPSAEAIHAARPHWDEAWFMLGLLALTSFHGLTMMPFWEDWINELARFIGDSGQLLWSFSLGLTASLFVPLLPYFGALWLTQQLTKTTLPIKQLFARFAFVAIPLAFAYHLAHNLNHLSRESVGASAVFANPFGTNTLPLSTTEKYTQHLQPLLSENILFALQSGLIIAGFLIAVQVIRQRGRYLLNSENHHHAWRLFPLFLFTIGITAYHLWLLMEPMVMRMYECQS